MAMFLSILTAAMETTQEEILKIARRFKQQDTTNHYRNKENQYRWQYSNRDTAKTLHQQMNRLIKIIEVQDSTVEGLITDGNRAFRIYQDMLNQLTLQMEELRDDYSRYREGTAEQKRQAEVLAQEMNTKIAALNAELSNKSEQYRDLLDRFEELQEKVKEVGYEERQAVKEIAEEYVRESSQFEQKFFLSNQEMDDLQEELLQAHQNIEQLQASNDFFRIMNDELIQNVEYLKNKLTAERQFICPAQPIQAIDRCEEEDSIEMDPSALQLKMYESHQMLMSREKEVLNISQHYSKFNRTEEYQSKEKDYYQFAITDSNDRKSFLKRRETNLQRKDLLKIDDEDAHDPIIEGKTQSRVVTEVKQFAQIVQYPKESQPIDPYQAFFTLLVQCQKMNSPSFLRIAHIDLSPLYGKLIEGYVPYNLWQEEIKKTIEEKLKRKKA